MDNRQIVSGSRDKTIKLWNTLAECKYTIQDDGHTDWVSCVRFSPNHANPIIVSAGWDRVVKVRSLPCKILLTQINMFIKMMQNYKIYDMSMNVYGYGTDVLMRIIFIISR